MAAAARDIYYANVIDEEIPFVSINLIDVVTGPEALQRASQLHEDVTSQLHIHLSISDAEK